VRDRPAGTGYRHRQSQCNLMIQRAANGVEAGVTISEVRVVCDGERFPWRGAPKVDMAGGLVGRPELAEGPGGIIRNGDNTVEPETPQRAIGTTRGEERARSRSSGGLGNLAQDGRATTLRATIGIASSGRPGASSGDEIEHRVRSGGTLLSRVGGE